MNAKHKAKLTMFRVIVEHLDGNAVIIAVVPALVAALTAFKAIIADILNTVQLKEASLIGITVDKGISKQTVAQIAADIAALIYAYAVAIGNNTLKAEVNFTVSVLSRMRDEELAPLCQLIHDRAFDNKDELADYAVTTAKLAELQTAIDNYSASTPKPRAALSNRKTYNANLTTLFKQGDDIINNKLDKLMVVFRTTHPDFYNNYFNLREIPDPHTTSTQLKGFVTNAADQTPIKNAFVTVVEAGKTAKTKSTGEYHFKPIPNGTYTVRVTAEGFEDFEKDEVEVKLGEVNHLDVELIAV